MLGKKYSVVLRATSPLGLLTLAACGGSNSISSDSVMEPVTGAVVNSPLQNALVFLDFDSDGDDGFGVRNNDEPFAQTASDGSFTIAAADLPANFDELTYRIVATSEEGSGVVNQEGQSVEGVTLVAQSGATVVTPFTTLIEASDMELVDFQEAMGIQFNPLTFNPYEDTSSNFAVEAAVKAKQVMTVLEAVASTSAGAGADQDQAMKSAVEAFVEVIEATSGSDDVLNLDPTSDGDDVQTLVNAGFAKVIEQDENVSADAVNALKSSVATAVENVVGKLEEISVSESSTIASSKSTFSTVNVLKEQLSETAIEVKAAVDAASDGADLSSVAASAATTATLTKLTLTDESALEDVITNIANNTAPTDITLSSTGAIPEVSSRTTVGQLSVTDDAAGGHTFVLVEESSTDFESFEIVGTVLYLKNGADFEAISSSGSAFLTAKVQVTDSFLASYEEILSIEIADVNEAISVTVTSSAITVSDNSRSTTIDVEVDDPEEGAVVFSAVDGVVAESLLTLQGDYGTLQVNVNTGAATYTLQHSGASYIALAGGEEKFDTFDLTVTEVGTVDPFSDSVSVNVKVVGADDAPGAVSIDRDSGDALVEGAAGLIIGTVSSVDPDGSAVAFDLTENSSGKVAMSSSGVLSLNDAWDYEVDGGDISFTVTATSGGLSSEAKVFSIPISDLNEAPEFGTGGQLVASDSVSEDTEFSYDFTSANGLQIVDEDATDGFADLTFTLNEDAPAWLSIDISEGHVKLIGTPATDADAKTHNVVLTASDGELSNDFALALTVTRTNDAPVFSIADEDKEISIGAGEVGSDILTGLSATDEESAASDISFFIVDSSGNKVTATPTFEVSGGKLKLLDTVTAAAGQVYDVTLVAQDAEGEYSNESSLSVTVSDTDFRPEIEEWSIETTSGNSIVGSGLVTISAIASEPVSSSDTDSASFAATLQFSDTQVQVITFTRDETDRTLFTGTFTVGSDTPNTSDLKVISYTAGTVVDGTDNPMNAESSLDVSLGLEIDTSAPAASVTVNNSTSLPLYTIDEVADTATLRLTINEVAELGFAAGADMLSSLDFTQLAWGIDDSTDEVPFLASYVSSATLTSINSDTGTGSLDIVLSTAGRAAIEDLSGFGGSATVDTLDVGAGFLSDVAGNASAAVARTNIDITMADEVAPTITSITAALSDTNTNGYANNGETLSFTATLSEAIKSGTKFSVDLGTGDTIEFTAASDTDTVTKDVVLASTFSDFAAGSMEVASLAVDTAADAHGNLVVDDTAIESFDNLSLANSFARDTSAPSVSVTVNNSTSLPLYTIDGVADTATLRLTINEVAELGFAAGADMLSSLDFTQLAWGIDDSTDEVPFLASYVHSATLTSIADDGTGTGSLDIVLSTAGRAAIEDLSGFGGSATVDTLDVGAGFLSDVAGNASAAVARTDIDITMADEVAPTITSITAALSDTNTNGYANNGETLSFTATLSEAIKSGTKFSVDLGTGDTIEFTAASDTDTVTKDVVLASTFSDFAAGSMEVASLAVDTAADAHGNLVVDDTAIESFDNLSLANSFARDTSAPSVSVTVNNSTSLPLYTIDGVADTATLRLTINEVAELGFAAGADMLSSLDFTQLAWGIDDSTDEVPFLASYVHSATLTSIADDGTGTGSLDIVLSTAGRAAIEDLSGFGGSATVDTLDVGAGFLSDVAGNASAAVARTDIDITMADEVAPTITSITAALSDTNTNGYANNGETLSFTATLSEAIKSGTKFSVDLGTGDTIEFTAASDTDTVTKDVVLASTFSDFAAGSMEVASLAVDTAADAHGNLVVDDTAIESFDNLSLANSFARDTSAPSVSVTVNNSTSLPLYTIDGVADTATLRLTINEVAELGFAAGADMLSSLDFTQLAWGIDDSTDEVPFLASYVHSATLTSIADDGTGTGSLDIVLSTAGRAAIEDLSGFGGSATVDTLDVGAGFLSDVAGNASAAVARTDIDITMADEVAPTITSITMAADEGGPFGIGDKITITAALSEAVSDDSELSFSLNNNVSVEATRSVDDNDSITGIYTISAEDDVANLSVLSYSVGDGSVDAHGNNIEGETTIASVHTPSGFEIDATLPYIALSNWNNTSDVIDLVFSERINTDTDSKEAILEGLRGLSQVANDATGSWSENDDFDTLLTVATSQDLVADEGGGSTSTLDVTFAIEDLVGNITNIDEIVFDIIA